MQPLKSEPVSHPKPARMNPAMECYLYFRNGYDTTEIARLTGRSEAKCAHLIAIARARITKSQPS